MSRDYLPFLRDIVRACERVRRYTAGMDYEAFVSHEMAVDAVLRNLATIGEAVKQIPADVQQRSSDIEWKKIARFRDLVIHHYFAVDNQIVWDVVCNKIPELEAQVQSVIAAEAPPGSERLGSISELGTPLLG